jgi:hypothetical protein
LTFFDTAARTRQQSVKTYLSQSARPAEGNRKPKDRAILIGRTDRSANQTEFEGERLVSAKLIASTGLNLLDNRLITFNLNVTT